MPIYRYTAMPTARESSATGGSAVVTKGTLAADSDQHLRAALRGMGLQPLSIRPLKHGPSSRTRRATTRSNASAPSTNDPDEQAEASSADPAQSSRRFALAASLASIARKRRAGALVEFYESLATLLASGAPLASSLDLLGPRSGAQTNGGGRSAVFGQIRSALTSRTPERRLETVCLSLAERVRSGAALAEALAEHPRWFGPVDRALVASCERSGHAEKALADLADLHARGEDLRGRLAGALAYPALLLVFGLGVVVFLTTTTLPQLAGVLEDGGAELPRATSVLLAFGGMLTTHWPLTVVMLLGLFAGISYLARSPRLARARLFVPLLGKAALRGQTSSAALLLARLLDAGVPLSESLELVAPSVPNHALRGELLALRDALVSGGSLSARASSGGLIEPVFCRVLEVAEESGEMAAALRAIGLRQRESAKRLIDRLAATLEPAVILMLACGIGFVVYASIAPMLRVAQTL
jgi:type II secretory pathway component PulF